MNSIQLSNSDNQKKFWQKPENLFIYGGLGLLGYGVLKGLDGLLPLINRVLENLLYTCLLAGGLGIVGFLVFSKDLHKLAWWGWKMAMKKLTRLFVEIDPLAILEIHIENLKDRLGEIIQALSGLRDQKRSLEAKIAEKSDDLETCMNTMSAAKKMNTPEARLELNFQAQESQRLEKSIKTFHGLLKMVDTHIRLNEKFKQGSEFFIRNTESLVASKKEEMETIQKSYAAMSASKRIIKAGEEREMFDMALEGINADNFAKLGEIDQFIEDSRSFLTGMDLQNGVMEEEGLKRLEIWEQKSDKLFVDQTGQPVLALPSSTSTLEVGSARQSYSELFR